MAKGFINIIVIIAIAVLVIGTGGYFVVSRISKPKTESDSSQEITTEIQKDSADKSTESPDIAPMETAETKQVIPEPNPQPIVQEESIVEPQKEIPIPTPKNACSRTFSPQFGSKPYYTGPLFDAHFHMPTLIDFSTLGGHAAELAQGHTVDKYTLLDSILCRFNEENVQGAIGFTIGAEEALAETIQTARSFNQRSSGKINLFLMPQIFSIDALKNIAISNEGLFKGYGEIAMYFGPQKGENPDSQKYLNIYEVAGKNNLIVMIHPDARQESSIENFLQKNPTVTFLIHGPEIENSITGIIGRHPNAYYSIDAILLRFGSPGGLLYTASSKANFISTVNQNFNAMLNDAVSKWKARIEQYPDRFAWGTDRSDEWTFDEEVGVLLEEFGRAFIGRLDPAVQERFAYKNAERLLRK